MVFLVAGRDAIPTLLGKAGRAVPRFAMAVIPVAVTIMAVAAVIVAIAPVMVAAVMVTTVAIMGARVEAFHGIGPVMARVPLLGMDAPGKK
ncbi:MAG TPA: hypothetical protein VNQ78_17475 [Paracoccus sp. (in: a-proteobacteria)]|nr:hypothetical protein [Paracoccus sp. (in: a-proteobacteria)]